MIPDLTGGTLVVAVLSFTAGASVPTYYWSERMRGFGRWLAQRIPYEPPPGADEETALREAAEDAGDVPGGDGE